MEQTTTTSSKPRFRAFSLQLSPRQLRIEPPIVTSMSYHRPLSPGGRRLQNPARVSDSFTDPYYTQVRHNSYSSPRTSGVIPLSSETFVTEQPRSAREPPRSGVYGGDYGAGRPRRSSLVDGQRASTTAINQLPSRSRPTIVHDTGRPSSPSSG